MKGFQLGTYILEDKLGEGGMAEVWRARNPVLNTYAAVKFLVPRLAGNPDIEKRFLGEGKRQAALQHPNIVSAFDFHYVDNRSFLVMRYIDGENLDHRLFKLQAPMSLPEAAAISRDVLSALDYAHSQGVVHRDIKPSNLLIENGGRVHVLDFGIALVLGEDRLTRVGAAIGTPHYMSPEQIVGARNIDGRTDIYSFGCVLYQILTQATPFDATEQEGNVDYIVKDRHLREEPVPPVAAQSGDPGIRRAGHSALPREEARRPLQHLRGGTCRAERRAGKTIPGSKSNGGRKFPAAGDSPAAPDHSCAAAPFGNPRRRGNDAGASRTPTGRRGSEGRQQESSVGRNWRGRCSSGGRRRLPRAPPRERNFRLQNAWHKAGG